MAKYSSLQSRSSYDETNYDSDNYDYDSNPVLLKRKNRRQKRRFELLQLVFTVIQAISILYSIGYYFFRLPASKSYSHLFYRCIFLLLTISSFSLWLVARIQLGTFLTFRPKAHETLVTTGIYKRFQHPIYYFGMLSLLFFLLLTENFRYLWVLLVLVPIQLYRATKERQVLKEKFDDIYIEYLKGVWI